MATVHDQEDERRGFDYDSRGNEEAVSVTMARVGLRGAAEAQRRENLPCHSIPGCAIDLGLPTATLTSNQRGGKTTGAMCRNYWKGKRLEDRLPTNIAGSVCCREEHGEAVNSGVGCLAAATKSLDLQMSLEDEQLRLVAAAVVEDRLLSWVPLHSPRASWCRVMELGNSKDE